MRPGLPGTVPILTECHAGALFRSRPDPGAGVPGNLWLRLHSELERRQWRSTEWAGISIETPHLALRKAVVIIDLTNDDASSRPAAVPTLIS